MSALDLTKEWPVSNASAGWVRTDGTRSTTGVSSRPFLLASVTKPLVSVALMIAVEEGSLNLDEPVGPPGSTIGHLLSHASGLGPKGEILAKPGERRIYSNHGFELLGFTLEQATGMTMATYLHEALAVPLALSATSLNGSPAHAGISCVDDLLVVVNEVMNPTLLSAETVAQMTQPYFGDLPGVLPGYGRQEPNLWGLGFEIKGRKTPHWTGATNSPETFGHFGQAGTFFWVDTAAGVACVSLTDEPFGPWAIDRWPVFSDAILGEAATP
jgi:CubicO group peptidase (beta-lactamase class C family)